MRLSLKERLARADSIIAQIKLRNTSNQPDPLKKRTG